MSHAADTGLMAHVKAWFERDVEPDLADLRDVAAKVRTLTPALVTIANVAVKLAEAADPAAAPEVELLADGAKEAAKVIEAIAAALNASRM